MNKITRARIAALLCFVLCVRVLLDLQSPLILSVLSTVLIAFEVQLSAVRDRAVWSVGTTMTSSEYVKCVKTTQHSQHHIFCSSERGEMFVYSRTAV
jgi:hypothetical protein